MKQITISTEHNMGNPDCSGATKSAISQAWSRIRTRGYRQQIQLAIKAGFELGVSRLYVQRSNHSATLPPFLNGTQNPVSEI